MDLNKTARVDDKSRAVCKAAASLVPAGLHTRHDLWAERGAGPPVIAKGKGATLTDVDGNDYIDYRCADGAMILGHADERVVVAVNKAVSKGCNLGSPSEMEVRLVELIASRYASIDMAQLFNSRVEAVGFAVRLARKHTNRRHIVEFEGSPQATAHSLTIPYNDLTAVGKLLADNAATTAAVLVEPVVTSYGLVPPAEGFLRELRALCDAHGALLIFDEGVVGLRLPAGGAAELFGVLPDLTILGPIVGGGLPLAACGGRREVMNNAAAAEEHNLAGASSANVIAIAAGIATLQAIGEADFYEDLEARSARLDEGVNAAAAAAQVAVRHVGVAGIISAFFTGGAVVEFAAAQKCDTRLASRYFHALLDQGIFLTPSPWPTMFVSAAHSDQQIDRTIEAVHNAMRVITTT